MTLGKWEIALVGQEPLSTHPHPTPLQAEQERGRVLQLCIELRNLNREELASEDYTEPD